MTSKEIITIVLGIVVVLKLMFLYIQDRIAKIQAINEQYNLEEKVYILYSGGKDQPVKFFAIKCKLEGEVDAYTDILCLIESSGVLDGKEKI